MNRNARSAARVRVGSAIALLVSAGGLVALSPFAFEGPETARAEAAGSSTASEPAIPAVSVTPPTRSSVTRFVRLPGRVQANRRATLHAKVSGYLAEIGVEEGDRVKKGQILARIEVPELSADLARFEAELAVAERDLERVTEASVKAPDLVVPQTVDEARGRVEIAQAEASRIRTLLGYTRITAPFDGIVTARAVDPGAFIPAATAASARDSGADAAAILTLMDFETVRIRVPVPEREAQLVRAGQPFHFTADVLEGRRFESEVSRIAYAVDPGTQTMMVEADVENRDLVLRPGMYVKARIGVERHDDVWTLPLAAVVVEKTTRSIFRLEGGVARKSPVVTGFDDGERIEIVQGVQGGESVILAGTARLADGQAVRVEERR